MNKISNDNLAKTMCYHLRHNPGEAGLELDEFGYANIDELAIGMSTEDGPQVSRDDILKVVSEDSKSRYRVKDNLIKCNFGHSIEVRLEDEDNVDEIIPDTLYHGINVDRLDSIFSEGIIPKSRQFVHVTSLIDIAINVGLRHCKEASELVILKIDAKAMIEDGIKVFPTESTTYLVDYIPSKYIISGEL